MTLHHFPTLPPPETPSSLWNLTRDIYGAAELARRALFAPLPLHGFESAYSFRHLWQAPQQGELARKRYSIEAELSSPLYSPAPILREIGEPFFPTHATDGRLSSPYPEIDDSYFWLIFMLNEQDAGATRRFFEMPASNFLGHSLLDLARWSRPVSSWRYLWLRVRKALDWKRMGYESLYRPVIGQMMD